MGAVHVRDAAEDDLGAVAEIYTYESLHSYSTFETAERPVDAWRPKLEAPYPFLVADHGGVIGLPAAAESSWTIRYIAGCSEAVTGWARIALMASLSEFQ